METMHPHPCASGVGPPARDTGAGGDNSVRERSHLAKLRTCTGNGNGIISAAAQQARCRPLACVAPRPKREEDCTLWSGSIMQDRFAGWRARASAAAGNSFKRIVEHSFHRRAKAIGATSSSDQALLRQSFLERLAAAEERDEVSLMKQHMLSSDALDADLFDGDDASFADRVGTQHQLPDDQDIQKVADLFWKKPANQRQQARMYDSVTHVGNLLTPRLVTLAPRRTASGPLCAPRSDVHAPRSAPPRARPVRLSLPLPLAPSLSLLLSRLADHSPGACGGRLPTNCCPPTASHQLLPTNCFPPTASHQLLPTNCFPPTASHQLLPADGLYVIPAQAELDEPTFTKLMALVQRPVGSADGLGEKRHSAAQQAGWAAAFRAIDGDGEGSLLQEQV